jgi:hypothetical protein
MIDLNRMRTLCRIFPATVILLSIALASVHAQTKDGARIPVDHAEQLVAAWLQAHQLHNGAARNPHPQLKDITPPDVWKRLGAQVFKQPGVTASIQEADAYLIRKGTVFPLSIGFGGSGLTSMCVCDLNRDGKLKLAYTYSWGSGITRSHLAVLYLEPFPQKFESDFQYRGDLLLKNKNDDLVNVYIVTVEQKSKPVQGPLLGRLTFNRNKRPALGVELNPGLPKKWGDGIWKTK